MLTRYYDAVYRFLHHLTRSREDAEDLAQQTFLKAVKGAKRYDPSKPLRSWLFGIAVREYARWRRGRIFRPIFLKPADVADPMERIVDARLLLDAMSSLEPGHRAAFLLHYVEGLSLQEIAQALGVPEGTVKSRLHNTRQRLKSTLEQEEFFVTEPCRP